MHVVTPTGQMTEEMLRSLTRQDVVTRSLLQSNAASHPDRRFAQFEDGTCWTYQEALSEAARAANVLKSFGVTQGSCVAIALPNGPAFLRALFGAAVLGATVLPINPAMRGVMLTRPLTVAEPKVLVADSAAISDGDLDSFHSLHLVDPTSLRGSDETLPVLAREIELWDDDKWLMTSGTTGPSKLVRIPYIYSFWGYSTILLGQNFGPDDVFQIDVPLFHAAAMGYVSATLACGSAIYVRSRPALDKYWEVAREARVTGGVLISSMVPVMMGYPPRDAERQHRVRFLVTAPVPPDISSFRQRFGVETVFTSLGSTEASTPLRGIAEPGCDPSFCGEIVPGFETRLVDENDQEVALGETGQLIVRSSRPFVMSPGYVNDPVATAEAWRNGWFHTGDLLRQDSSGRYYFVDRSKDVIRRRGENISAYEVELAIDRHCSVKEVACVPVPSDTGVDDEVKAFIVLKPGSTDTHADLLEHAFAHLPHHMVPRYLEFIEEIPKTPTGKPQKYVLRDRGNSGSTWDSHDHGYIVTRHGLKRPEAEGAC
ncbi:AMP-binding protein [Mycolicibacterium vaccae]|uniref:AMP-binding protein n=1 Tax=Mycolicibacterium vaccae TaxID=1810 RepID=UPI003D067502